MKNLRRVVLVLGGATAGLWGGALAFVGCSDNNGTVINNDGGEAGDDVKNDVTADQDAEGVDAGDADASAPETGDAQPDGNNPAYGFAGQVAAAMCDRVLNCCQADAAAFDMSNCVATATTFGYQGSNAGWQLVDGGNVKYDPALAQKCLADIAAIDCAANTVTTAQKTAIMSDCFGALTGTLAAGQPCKAPIECTSGNFCAPADGGANVCTPLRGQGGLCADWLADASDPNAAVQGQQACSYRASGDTNRTCQFADFDSGLPINPSQWSCVPDQALDNGCNADLDCLTRMCSNTTFVCISSQQFASAGTCAFYKLDGGGD